MVILKELEEKIDYSVVLLQYWKQITTRWLSEPCRTKNQINYSWQKVQNILNKISNRLFGSSSPQGQSWLNKNLGLLK